MSDPRDSSGCGAMFSGCMTPMAAVIARLTIPQPEPMHEVVMVKPECRKARSPHRAGFVDHRLWRRGWDSNPGGVLPPIRFRV